MSGVWSRIVAALVAVSVGVAVAASHWPAGEAPEVPAGVAELVAGTVATAVHDPGPAPRGLAFADGTVYEGAGRAGALWLREISLASRRLVRSAALPVAPFAGDGGAVGGVVVVGPRVWQFGAGGQVAVQWDRATLRVVRTVPLPGPAAGVCDAGDGTLLASDGGGALRRLTADDLTDRGSVRVRLGGRDVGGLGELECVRGTVWAAVLGTGRLLRIDPVTGAVTGVAASPGSGAITGVAWVAEADALLITVADSPTMSLVRIGERP